MSDDTQNDDDANVKKTQKDDVTTGEKSNVGLYDTNPNKDYIDKSDLNSSQAPLNEGLGDDAYDDYDLDDATLTAENDSDETETGMEESDGDNLKGKQNLGDVVVDEDQLA